MCIWSGARAFISTADGLGDFIELEVVLAQDDDETGGEQEAHDMFARLGVTQADLVPLAYVDLLNPAEESPASSAK